MLPLEPPRLVPAAVDPHPDVFTPDPVLADVDDAGRQVYAADDPSSAFSAAVHRLWDERGDFSKLSVPNIAHSRIPQHPPASDLAAHPSPSDAPLTPAQLWAIKSQLIHDIGIARQTAIQASHFLDLLIPSSLPDVPRDPDLTLPPNSLRTSSISLPPPDPPPALRAANLALSLSTTTSSIQQTTSLFKDASTRLQSQTHKSNLWWKELSHLRSNGVPLESRGARTGAKLYGPMSELLAKDIVVFCGLSSHLNSHWGHLAYAQLNFPKDDNGNDIPDSLPTLKLPDRELGRRRLKVVLHKHDKIISQTTPQNPPPSPELKNLEIVESAQRDFLDQDIFEWILQEAKTDSSSSFEFRSDSISVQLADEQTLTLSLERVDHHHQERQSNQEEQLDHLESNSIDNENSHPESLSKSPSKSPSNLPSESPSSSALANLIYAALQISFLHRPNIKKPSQEETPSNTNDQDNTKILTPLIGLFSYYSQAKKVLNVLNLLRKHLSQLGINVSLNWKPAITTAEELFGFASSSSSSSSSTASSPSVGGLGSLLVDSCHPIQISISPPTSLHFHSSTCSVPVSSSDHLDHLLSTEMSHYIQAKWIPKLQKLPPAVKISVDYSLKTGFAVGLLVNPEYSSPAVATNNNSNTQSDSLKVWSAASSEEPFQTWLKNSIQV